ncbi:MAG: outer membrane beta-barrel protein [Bacteroidia bacterium]|nr:outer membrane beta-barrel protein [Bacteroidia bacterium]
MGIFKKVIILSSLLISATKIADAQNIRGIVTDAVSGDILIGAYIEAGDGEYKAISSADGTFILENIKSSPVTLKVSYLGFINLEIADVAVPQDSLVIGMVTDEQALLASSVTAEQRRNTAVSLMRIASESPVIISNISAQEISRTQDSNAGEVIRRIPGVSLIDEKYVMVRGLAQRYNNVWINGGAVPSSEADSRAFSFDLIPSSQIDNLTIVKVPASEYPADYSGGFIIIGTRDVPEKNSFSISAGGNFNDCSFRDFLKADGRLKSLKGGMGSTLDGYGGKTADLRSNHLDNDWTVRRINPLFDRKFGTALARRFERNGHKFGLDAAVNCSEEFRTLKDMQNNLFGAYDYKNGKSNYLRHSVDDQYNDNTRLGALLNLVWLSSGGVSKYQFKNIFNRIGNSRYTIREGVSAQANQEIRAEYYRRIRNTYNGQMAGRHDFTDNVLDWCAGWSYADRIIPDRRRYLINDALESGVYALTTGNDISREWTALYEHISSLSLNDRQNFRIRGAEGYVKGGAYAEYRARRYDTRSFIYNWNAYDNTLPEGFRQMDIPTLLSDEKFFSEDRLHLIEQQRMRDNYRGGNILAAGYLSLSLPLGKVSILSGLRFEHNDMELISNTRNTEVSESSRHYVTDDIFPSIAATWRIDERNNLRLSYGRTINRPEFREVSSSVYYDFDLASDVQGNADLESCRIDNLDLRYEFYPGGEETVSIAAFYKHFDSPVEWTYTVSGGTDLVYSYENALAADNYGVEADIRKSLSFIGLDNFSLSFNGALIRSRVRFGEDSREEDRPMQGQSPYLVNAGLFYGSRLLGTNVALLYNRIGKRIIGVGRSAGSGENSVRVPDSYEMPRNSLDLTFSKSLRKHAEVKFYIRNILGESVYYKQFAGDIEQVTRSWNPGRNIGLHIIYTL